MFYAIEGQTLAMKATYLFLFFDKSLECALSKHCSLPTKLDREILAESRAKMLPQESSFRFAVILN